VNSVVKSNHWVLIIGDGHTKQCATKLRHNLYPKCEVSGFFKPGIVSKLIRSYMEKRYHKVSMKVIIIKYSLNGSLPNMMFNRAVLSNGVIFLGNSRLGESIFQIQKRIIRGITERLLLQRMVIDTNLDTNKKTKTNSVAFSPRANYTDWATATCQRNSVPTFVDGRVSRGQRGRSPTVINLSFLDWSRYFSFK
jgi:hypothetical protein